MKQKPQLGDLVQVRGGTGNVYYVNRIDPRPVIIGPVKGNGGFSVEIDQLVVVMKEQKDV